MMAAYELLTTGPGPTGSTGCIPHGAIKPQSWRYQTSPARALPQPVVYMPLGPCLLMKATVSKTKVFETAAAVGVGGSGCATWMRGCTSYEPRFALQTRGQCGSIMIRGTRHIGSDRRGGNGKTLRDDAVSAMCLAPLLEAPDAAGAWPSGVLIGSKFTERPCNIKAPETCDALTAWAAGSSLVCWSSAGACCPTKV